MNGTITYDGDLSVLAVGNNFCTNAAFEVVMFASSAMLQVRSGASIGIWGNHRISRGLLASLSGKI